MGPLPPPLCQSVLDLQLELVFQVSLPPKETKAQSNHTTIPSGGQAPSLVSRGLYKAILQCPYQGGSEGNQTPRPEGEVSPPGNGHCYFSSAQGSTGNWRTKGSSGNFRAYPLVVQGTQRDPDLFEVT